ncbi:type IV toxin-antitoxin system AbiEi family antitoxin, partial [Kibdelosporangium lantanae]
RFRIADSDVQELLAAPRVAVGGISAADAYQLGLGHGAEAEIYVDEATLDRLVDEFFLLESAQGNLVVHVVDDQWHWRTRRVHQGQVVTPRLVVAADLLESDDTRSRSAGRQLLTTTVDNGLRGMT